VTRLILGEGLRLAGIGAGIGIVGSVALAQLSKGLLVDALPWDPALPGAAGLIMIGVAALAAFIPARRAGAIDPIVVLRND
jgi:ABC-type antimicrobial peptide transport system permease subunit